MSDNDIDFVTLASKTEGYSISDLGDLANNASQQAIIRSSKESPGDVSYRL
jgi:peroxin-1